MGLYWPFLIARCVLQGTCVQYATWWILFLPDLFGQDRWILAKTFRYMFMDEFRLYPSPWAGKKISVSIQPSWLQAWSITNIAGQFAYNRKYMYHNQDVQRVTYPLNDVQLKTNFEKVVKRKKEKSSVFLTCDHTTCENKINNGNQERVIKNNCSTCEWWKCYHLMYLHSVDDGDDHAKQTNNIWD